MWAGSTLDFRFRSPPSCQSWRAPAGPARFLGRVLEIGKVMLILMGAIGVAFIVNGMTVILSY